MRKLTITSFILAAVLLTAWPGLQAQRKPKPAVASEFGNVEGVTAAQIRDYLYFVASDEMEGRDTPSRGLDLTAKFIALNLSRWGLKPAGTDGTFFQKIELNTRQVKEEGSSATINGQSYKLGQDFIAQPFAGTAAGNLVYVSHGYMIKSKGIDAYKGIDVRDKIMLVVEAMPGGVTFRDLRGKPGEDFATPESYALMNGAKGIVRIPNSSTLNFWEQRHKSSLTPSRPMMAGATGRRGMPAPIPTITASAKMVNDLLAGEQLDYETIKGQVQKAELGGPFALSPAKKAEFTVTVNVGVVWTQNVVAILEGGDSNLKDEYVAIGAHYDHVGINPRANGEDKIFNGADDDGSGTVAVLAIAEALAQGPRPKRSILFVWHAGEEKGLWGSDYVTDNPPVPLDRIIAQLNIDMIGRSRKEGDTNPRNVNLTGPDEIYVIGSRMMSTDLGNLSESVNKSFLNLKFNYKYDDPNDPERFFFRSDHYNYARKGIPIIFYFDGVHEDYHRASDHPDKIDYEKMEKVTRTIMATLWKLTSVRRPVVDKQLPAQLLGN
ncbi:MAG: M20/M25/M40 family metallo-hydrolase [Acidobacteriota bacterium]|nr:MAG: M20/M25/M40 family metallo-hydrolase [Acidobacteriota bacterium]